MGVRETLSELLAYPWNQKVMQFDENGRRPQRRDGNWIEQPVLVALDIADDDRAGVVFYPALTSRGAHNPRIEILSPTPLILDISASASRPRGSSSKQITRAAGFRRARPTA